MEQSTSGQVCTNLSYQNNDTGLAGGNEDAGTAFGGRYGKNKLKFCQIITKTRIIKQIGIIAPVASNAAHTDPTELIVMLILMLQEET